MLPITKRQIQYNYSNRNGTPIKYIVIHDTGNRSAGSTAQMHFTYFNGGNRNASADFFVDDHSIWQVNDYKIYNTWQCGDGNGAYGITNKNSLGIEMCINSDGNFNATFQHTIELTKYLMRELNIPIDRVVRHYDASRKNCPQNLNYNGWEGWIKFKNALKETPPQPQFTVSPKDGIVTILADVLNIRSTPDGNIVGTANKNSNFQVTGITNNGWFRIPYNGGIAYVSANIQYVKFSENIWGFITMQNLEEVKKALNIPTTLWAGQEIQKAKANGIIKSDHSTEELVTFGTLCTMLNNIYDQLKRKGSL